MMGVWFLAISLGNFIGGRVAGLFEAFPCRGSSGPCAWPGLAAAWFWPCS